MNGIGDDFRALIVQHEDSTPPGVLGEWLADSGAHVEVFRIDIEERRPEPRNFDLIASLGSQYAAFDDSLEWIDREKELLLKAAGADVPILGLCFGCQLLARILGGECFRGALPEVGWFPVRSHDPELVPKGPWLQWHFDTFTLPQGASLIADSPAGPQAFAFGRSLGLQFHPEATAQIVGAWVKAYPHELAAVGVDPDELLAEAHRTAAASRRIALRLFERFVEDVAGLRLPDTGGDRLRGQGT